MNEAMESENLQHWYDSLNLNKTCAKFRVSIWQCPQFLFLVMGAFIIAAVLVTYQITKTYQEPEIAALIVLGLSAVLFAIGSIIVNSFERMARSALSKSEFISIISHQLRSPLSAIKWQLNIVFGNKSEPAPSYVEDIYQQNERMIRSINDLLDVNRIDDNDIVLRPAPFSLASATKKAMDSFRKLALAKNIKISLLEAPDLPQVYADGDKILSAIEHLLDNAIRYSVDGGEVVVSIEKGKTILWKITDQGPGIPKEDQKRIFEKFFRADSAAKYQTAGSGVGLFIAKSIIKLSGGEIGFSSAPNKGSTFWFSLPTGDKFTS